MYGDMEPGVSMGREVEARLTLAQVRAVALPSRLRILRSLAKQRATITELSERAGIPKSTVLKHLRALQRHGLVRRNDDDHLWIYYDLTGAGRSVGRMDPLRIFVLLSLAAAGALFAGAIGVWWWGGQTRASDNPWTTPPIGVEPAEPTARVAAYVLAATGALLLVLAAWLWRRARARATAEGPVTDTSSSP